MLLSKENLSPEERIDARNKIVFALFDSPIEEWEKGLNQSEVNFINYTMNNTPEKEEDIKGYLKTIEKMQRDTLKWRMIIGILKILREGNFSQLY